jgi:hypothetical protein
MKQPSLATTLVAMAALGGVFAAVPFVKSLGPSARTDAALPRLESSMIAAGSYKYVTDPYSMEGWESEILMIRSRDGVLRAWFIPVKGGVRRLPDGPLWRPGRPCRELIPDFEREEIYCTEPNQSEWDVKRYRWNLEGKSLFNQTVDMVPIQGVEESGNFVLLKRGAA